MKLTFVNVLIAWALGMLLFGCEEAKDETEWLLEGELKNHKGGLIHLERLFPDSIQHLDSTMAEEGKFSFRGKADAGAFYQIRLGADRNYPFMPESDALHFSLDESVPSTWKFTGNKASALIKSFVTERGRLFGIYRKDKNAMRLVPKSTTLNKWREAEAQADRSLIEYRNYVRGFIDTVSVPELRSYATFSMNTEANFNILQGLYERLKVERPESDFTAFTGQKLAGIGEPFLRWEGADVVGTGLDGEQHSLKNERGKLTLLYFWAGYCEFSRQENKLLTQVYEANKDRGFTIFSVSIDDLESEWREVSAADHIDWPANIRVEKSWNSPVFGDYSVQSIPTTFLIDEKGIIRTKNIRADELEADMDQLLKQYGPPMP